MVNSEGTVYVFELCETGANSDARLWTGRTKGTAIVPQKKKTLSALEWTHYME